MTTLDETIRGLVARGDLTHLSLTPSQNGKLWRASFSPSSVFGSSFAEDADPIAALIRAMTTMKLKSRAPSDRELAAREARAPAVIEQAMVEVTDAEVDALM